jgi:hypothetical protein
MKIVSQIYGNLWLKNGKEIELDGPTPKKFDPTNIESIGEHEIGDDANVCVIYSDSSKKLIKTVADTQKFFTKLFK